ncbi:hypothetical protein [Acetobacter persici]|uniref:Uncharacterized protein n=1 Tax=Acetobacter persici TaxID=1076596 RepID=A0A1U9LJR6_9PROT|nr:hypothetical protein [Acetobacter persici]AQT06704.1 hypothetical protein A0U91_17020 [Acetobacter persici]
MAQAEATNINHMLNSALEKFQCPEDVKEAGPGSYQFSMDVDVHDPEVFYKAAIAHYVKENLPADRPLTQEILLGLIAQADLTIGGSIDGAVTQICDPGQSPLGAQIQNSGTDYVSGVEGIDLRVPDLDDEGPCP